MSPAEKKPQTLSDEALAKLVHDLKAPLRQIVSFSGLLETEAKLDDDQQAYLEFIQSAADSLGIQLERLVELLQAAQERTTVPSASFSSFQNGREVTAAEPAVVSAEDPYRSAKVLFVEDSPQDAAIFIKHCRTIEGYEWQIDHRSSYQAACQAIQNQSYDLYFFDYYLDEGTGLDLIAELRPQHQHGPVLVITGLDDAEIGEQALIAGATGYAPKHQLTADVIYRVVRHSHIRRQAEIKLEEQACEDGLTGAFNRSHFIQLSEIELARAKRFGYTTSLMMLDIDNFKEINDQHGHLLGDQAIISVVSSAQTVLRASDVLARFGGDEFVVLMPQTSAEDAFKVAVYDWL